MKKSAPFVAVLLAFATVWLGPSAQAATGSIKDKVRDAPAKFDLTRLKVSHTSTEVVITAKVRAPGKRDTQFFAYNLYGATTSYAGTSHRSRRGGSEEAWYQRRSDGILAQAECATRTRWAIGRRTIRTTIPRSCVGEAGDLTISASLGSGARNGDQADLTRRILVPQD